MYLVIMLSWSCVDTCKGREQLAKKEKEMNVTKEVTKRLQQTIATMKEAEKIYEQVTKESILLALLIFIFLR